MMLYYQFRIIIERKMRMFQIKIILYLMLRNLCMLLRLMRRKKFLLVSNHKRLSRGILFHNKLNSSHPKLITSWQNTCHQWSHHMSHQMSHHMSHKLSRVLHKTDLVIHENLFSQEHKKYSRFPIFASQRIINLLQIKLDRLIPGRLRTITSII